MEKKPRFEKKSQDPKLLVKKPKIWGKIPSSGHIGWNWHAAQDDALGWSVQCEKTDAGGSMLTTAECRLERSVYLNTTAYIASQTVG